LLSALSRAAIAPLVREDLPLCDVARGRVRQCIPIKKARSRGAASGPFERDWLLFLLEALLEEVLELAPGNKETYPSVPEAVVWIASGELIDDTFSG
jgi:hypothetical protein